MRASLFFLLMAGISIKVIMPVVAHQSHDNYAISEFTPLQGIVEEVHLINRTPGSISK